MKKGWESHLVCTHPLPETDSKLSFLWRPSQLKFLPIQQSSSFDQQKQAHRHCQQNNANRWGLMEAIAGQSRINLKGQGSNRFIRDHQDGIEFSQREGKGKPKGQQQSRSQPGPEDHAPETQTGDAKDLRFGVPLSGNCSPGWQHQSKPVRPSKNCVQGGSNPKLWDTPRFADGLYREFKIPAYCN